MFSPNNSVCLRFVKYRVVSLRRPVVTAVMLAACLLTPVLSHSTASGAEAAGESVTVFLIGDSTVKNGRGQGDDGLWGWGQVLQNHFDYTLATVENRALGGRSSRTYLSEGLWAKTLERIKPGDFVLIQFGHNDGGQMFTSDRPRASIKGNGDESVDGVVELTGKAETVRSYGWYLRRYANDTMQKGATPVILSPVPRNRWRDGGVQRAAGDYGKWAREAAEECGAFFVDLNAYVADHYEAVGAEVVGADYFTSKDNTHTSRHGAEASAERLAAALRDHEDCDLKDRLLPSPDAIRFRYESVAEESGAQRSFTFPVPEGNHLVRVHLGSTTAANTGVQAELRRTMIAPVATRAGEVVEHEFLVNTRTPKFSNGRRVRLKDREKGKEAAAWDTSLTITLSGSEPRVTSIEVLPPPEECLTVYLLGDSTVADQPLEPWASWGQKLPRHFRKNVCVANHSESGETINSSWGAGRCDKLLDRIAEGDWLLIQFGHNDMKNKKPDALQRYEDGLRRLVAAARDRGANPVLVTSMERMAGVEADTLGEYPQAVRDLAAREGVPLIDLHARSIKLYRQLGERLPSAFQDGTHHNDYGAELIAGCVVEGLIEAAPALAQHLSDAPITRP